MALSDLRGAQEKHEGSAPLNGITESADRGREQSLKHVVQHLKDEPKIEEITKVFGERQWNQYAAARRLKISYRGLLYKIQHYRRRPSGRSRQFNLTLSILEMAYEA